jgi:hypothetical protein
MIEIPSPRLPLDGLQMKVILGCIRICVSNSCISSGKRKLSGTKRYSCGKNLYRRDKITHMIFFLAKCYRKVIECQQKLTSISGNLLIKHCLLLNNSTSLSLIPRPNQRMLPFPNSLVSLKSLRLITSCKVSNSLLQLFVLTSTNFLGCFSMPGVEGPVSVT